uniref:Uncharacterized protein n=1 Tax=Physcomitrium patens TaxID=3218 RepID=A0A2K1JMB8_PHYPA|nr:hypothetical protein PHYPA_017535 [Physcomitrium patens]
MCQEKKKWDGILPPNFKMKWTNIWDKEWVRKEAGLLWLTWHRAVAVNAWRSRGECLVHNSTTNTESSNTNGSTHPEVPTAMVRRKYIGVMAALQTSLETGRL